MRILHTMLRVGDLKRSIRFYTEVLGMQVMRTSEFAAVRFALVGYADQPGAAEIELICNRGVDKYDLGTAYGHIALEVEDAAAACQIVKAKGGKVVREAGLNRPGTLVVAFIEDPDGYQIEFVEKKRG